MLNKYSFENISKITINQKHYYIYKHVLHRLHFFNCLIEDKIETTSMIIEWDVSEKIIILLFELVDGSENTYSTSNNCTNLSELLQFISFGRYLMAPEKIIESYTHQYFKNVNLIEFAEDCAKIQHSEYFEYIFDIVNFDIRFCIYDENTQEQLNNLAKLDLHDNFKMHILSAYAFSPHQYPLIYAHIYNIYNDCYGEIWKTTGYNPLNGNFYYYYAINNNQWRYKINEITINNLEYTNCILTGAPKIENGDIIYIKNVGTGTILLI